MSQSRQKITSFKDLEIWQRGITLVEKIYEVTRSFPKEELYGLTGQMRRASVAMPSNTAELATQTVIANRLGYLTAQTSEQIQDEVEQWSKMTMSLIKKP